MFSPKPLALFFSKTAFALYFSQNRFAPCISKPSARLSQAQGALDARGGEAVRTPNGFPYIPARLRQTRLPMMAAAPVTATRASTAAANTPRSAVDGVDVSDDAALDSSSPARLPNARISET